MPKRTTGRTLTHEANLAQRIRVERNERGWSYETLAAKMAGAGCRIPASAIFKIENGEPPRRITVDEFLAFAAVLKIKPENLVMPLEVSVDAYLQDLMSNVLKASQDCQEPLHQLHQAYSQLLAHDPDSLAQLQPMLTTYWPSALGKPKVAGSEIVWRLRLPSSGRAVQQKPK